MLGGEGPWLINSFDQKAHIITLTLSTKSRPLNESFQKTKEKEKKREGEIDG